MRDKDNKNNIINKILSFFQNINSEKKDSGVVVRIAPSPTGNLHIGTARTALFNYLFAKQNNGKFILRVEDTDKERSKSEFEENIDEGLKWLGINYDEKFKQSERTDIYKKYLNKLIESGHAYISQEVPKEKGQRSEVIRFKNPNKKIKFNDLVRGEIEFDTTDLGDFVIAKSVDEPLYHLAVVVDDHEMQITHIIRGEDHISNTPRQILIQEAIGANKPKYAHMALILNQDKSKLSKRDGATSVSDYKSQGILPEAFVNFLAMMGWAPKDEQEIFSMNELIEKFRIDDLQKGGATFNLEKLKWFNKEWIKKIEDKEIIRIIKEHEKELSDEIILKALPEIKDRIETLKDLESIFKKDGEFYYLKSVEDLDIDKINWKNNSKEISQKHLENTIGLINTIDSSSFKNDKIKEVIFEYADKEGRGDVLWPLRYSLSGKEKSIDPFNLIYILGKEESIKRIQNAIKKLT